MAVRIIDRFLRTGDRWTARALNSRHPVFKRIDLLGQRVFGNVADLIAARRVVVLGINGRAVPLVDPNLLAKSLGQNGAQGTQAPDRKLSAAEILDLIKTVESKKIEVADAENKFKKIKTARRRMVVVSSLLTVGATLAVGPFIGAAFLPVSFGIAAYLGLSLAATAAVNFGLYALGSLGAKKHARSKLLASEQAATAESKKLVARLGDMAKLPEEREALARSLRQLPPEDKKAALAFFGQTFTADLAAELRTIMQALKLRDELNAAWKEREEPDPATVERATNILPKLKPDLPVTQGLAKIIARLTKRSDQTHAEALLKESYGDSVDDLGRAARALSNLTEIGARLDPAKQNEQALAERIKTRAAELQTRIGQLKKDHNVEHLSGRADEHGQAGKYTLIESVGRGGMGEVWLAVNADTQAQVAIKFLPMKKIIEDTTKAVAQTRLEPKGRHVREQVVSLILRFHNEYTTGQALKHDHLCPAFDSNLESVFPIEELKELFRKDNPLPEDERNRRLDAFDLNAAARAKVFIASEFVPEKPGSKEPAKPITKAYRGKMIEEDIESLMLPLMDGLILAHEQGIVHRDLKPANILAGYREDGSLYAKIIDFGIAKNITGETELTILGMAAGTPNYRPPYNYYNEGNKDHNKLPAIDLFYFGVCLIELITGRNPFRGLDEIAYEKYLHEPTEINVDEVPPALQPVIRRMLTPTVAGNFASMKEARLALKEALIAAKGERRPSTIGLELDDIEMEESVVGTPGPDVDAFSATDYSGPGQGAGRGGSGPDLGDRGWVISHLSGINIALSGGQQYTVGELKELLQQLKAIGGKHPGDDDVADLRQSIQRKVFDRMSKEVKS